MKILNKQHNPSGGATKKNNSNVDHPVSTGTTNTNTASVKSPFSSRSSSSSINLLSALLRQVNTTKFSPCQSCPSLATNIIERYFTASLRQRKTQSRDTSSRNNLDMIAGATNATLCHQNSPTSSLISLSSANQAYMHMSPSPSPPPFSGSSAASLSPFVAQCFFVNECHTFILPNDIEDFSPRIQHILFDELLDREVQQELENESRVINWNLDLTNRLNSRLYPLWNRHSGDCLLDSVLQACYGVFDTDNTLRHVMAESLEMYAGYFKPRWKQHEIQMAQSLHYTLDDYQLEQDWNNILALAHQPGKILSHFHNFICLHKSKPFDVIFQRFLVRTGPHICTVSHLSPSYNNLQHQICQEFHGREHRLHALWRCLSTIDLGAEFLFQESHCSWLHERPLHGPSATRADRCGNLCDESFNIEYGRGCFWAWALWANQPAVVLFTAGKQWRSTVARSLLEQLWAWTRENYSKAVFESWLHDSAGQ